jgi:formylglycine-generating enzyme required for sulfatase activity
MTSSARFTSPAPSGPKAKNPSAGVLVLTALGSILTLGLMMVMVLGPSAPDEEAASRSSSAPPVETTQQEPDPAPPVPSVSEPNPTIEPPVAPAPVTAPSPVPPVATTPPQAAPSPVPATIDESTRMEGTSAGEVRNLGGIEMVWCPPGEFLMGSPTSEADRRNDETQHRVTLTTGFWMAKTETTQGQWVSVMGDNPSTFKGMDLPVETVNWDDVQGWLGKMNERHPLPAGWKWELPTEAQWEYACRAGTETAYAGVLTNMAWYADNSGLKPNPVGAKQANAWGLHDMHGTVFEWCRDWYGDYPSGVATNPTGATTGSLRVLRGGSWGSDAALCRSAYRFVVPPDSGLGIIGFRVAVVPAGR